MLTALACAALLLLAEQPLYARSASFLLSFGAVLGIGLVYPALLELVSRSGGKRLQASALKPFGPADDASDGGKLLL